MDHLWNRTLGILKDEVDENGFKNWVKPLTQTAADKHTLRLIAPNRTVHRRFREKYQAAATAALRKISGRTMNIEIEVGDRTQLTFDQTVIGLPGGGSKSTARKRNGRHLPNDEYTFDNFVVGDSNNFAFAACKNVANNPGRGMNPLFIYGGTGLGKTHLLNAIGLTLLKRDPNTRLMLVSAERFMNELISAIQGRRTAAFQKKYRNLDALLIDDIQIIGGKHATQEEFFHTFNTLYEGDAQIVLASDKYPKEIPRLEERLCSRFGMGMIADIQPPELETRIAIVKKKAVLEGVNLPDDVAFFIASHIPDNVRELEGALRRVAAFSELQGGKILLETAKRALRNVIGDPDKPITIEQVQRSVCEYYQVKHSDLIGIRKYKAIARPRQVAMYLARKLTDSSLPDIAAKFGNRDHTTVLHAVRKVEKLNGEDRQLSTILETLEKTLRN